MNPADATDNNYDEAESSESNVSGGAVLSHKHSYAWLVITTLCPRAASGRGGVQ